MDLWLPPAKPAIIRTHKEASFLPGMFPGGAAAVGTPTLSYVTTTFSTTDQTNYSFAGTSIGAAEGTRRVFVAVHSLQGGISSVTPTSVTIGGVSATSHVTIADLNTRVSIWSALVPTGTTATIDVVFSTNQNCVHIGVWAGYKLSDSSPTGTAQDAASATPSLSVATTGDCIIIAAGSTTGAGASGVAVFTGVTERYDTFNGDIITASAGDISAFAGSSPTNVTITYTGTSTRASAAVSWR